MAAPFLACAHPLLRAALLDPHADIGGDLREPEGFQAPGRANGLVQIFAGSFIPASYPDLPIDGVCERWIGPLMRQLAKRLPEGYVLTGDALHLPHGIVDASQMESGGVSLRGIIVNHPCPTLELGHDYGAVVKPYYNIELECVERRYLLPVLRFDALARPAG
jgi:hypothetical protein